MEKIAIFVEGQTETIFLRTLLLHIFNPDFLSIYFTKLVSDSSTKSIYDITNPNAILQFQIFDVGGEGNVLGSIKEREVNIFNQGYKIIIGLQDMYSTEYEKLSPGKINPRVISKIVSIRNEQINKMQNARNIRAHYSIMEIEAWFLAMYWILEKIDSKLTLKFITSKLRIDLSAIDPQVFFFKPSSELNKIYKLVGKRYNKSVHCAESLMSKMNKKDFDIVLNSGRVKNLANLYNEIVNGYKNLVLSK